MIVGKFAVTGDKAGALKRHDVHELVHNDTGSLWVDSDDKLVLVFSYNGCSINAMAFSVNGGEFTPGSVRWPIQQAPVGKAWTLQQVAP